MMIDGARARWKYENDVAPAWETVSGFRFAFLSLWYMGWDVLVRLVSCVGWCGHLELVSLHTRCAVM